MKIWVKARLAFTIVILLILLWAFLAAWDWPSQARLFPLAVCIPTFVLCLFQLGRDLFMEQKQATAKEDRWIVDLPSKQGLPLPLVLRRAGNISCWILGLLFSIWFVGFIISIPLFMWSYLIVQGRTKWWVALLYTALAQAFLLGIFHYTLHIHWIEGLISWPQEVVLEWIGK